MTNPAPKPGPTRTPKPGPRRRTQNRTYDVELLTNSGGAISRVLLDGKPLPVMVDKRITVKLPQGGKKPGAIILGISAKSVTIKKDPNND